MKKRLNAREATCFQVYRKKSESIPQSIDYGIPWLGRTVQNWVDSNDIDMPYWSEKHLAEKYKVIIIDL